MKRLTCYLIGCICSMTASSQQIERLEYFFDTDPGYGSATEIPITPDNIIEAETSISVSGLSDGIHMLYARAKDTSGDWSFIQKVSFIKDPDEGLQNADIVEVEYYFDADPGYGNGIELDLTPGSNILVLETASLDALTDGIHILYVRAKDDRGRWSFIQKNAFVKDQYASGAPADITEMEFFIDTDPGYGNGFPLQIQDSTVVMGDTAIDLNSLSHGIHVLYGRIKNAIGRWGFVQKRSFLFESEYVEVAQFKFDSLPGYENWVPSDTFSPFTDIIAEVDFEGICDLDTGTYYIDSRVRRMFSWWSKVYRDSIEIKNFYLQTGAVIDQFGDSIPDVVLHVQEVDTVFTDATGFYSFLVPKCWGDSVLLFRDSLYSALKSNVFQNPKLDYSAHHILGDIDSVLIGYKCINQSGTIPTNLSYVCEDASITVTKTGAFVDTGSVSGYVLHDGVLTLGTVHEMNYSGMFENDGSLPQNVKLYISPIVGRPGEPLIDVNHACTDIMLPGKPVVFLNSKDTIWLQLDSVGATSVMPDTLLESSCSTCDIDDYTMTQTIYGCPDHGTQTEFLTIEDGEGNFATCPITVIVLDTITPVITCRTDTLVFTDPAQCDFSAIGNELDPIFTWDNCPVTLINSFSSTASLEDIPIPLGLHVIQWTINDNHGNTASCSFNITVEDHESPQITCQTTPMRSTNPGTCTYTIVGSELNPVSVTDNCTAFTYWNETTNTSTLAGLTLELGSHLITWIVDDGHGQFDTCATTVTIEDNEIPQIVCAASAMRTTDTSACTYEISWTEFDPIAVDDNCTAYTYSNNSSFTTTLDGVVLSLGSNVITWTVDDGHGQQKSCNVAITVVDDEVPVIACATDAVRNTDPGECDYTVVGNEFNPVTVTDNCTSFTYVNDVTNTNTLAGATLPFGENLIFWTVNDGHGNTASCSMTIEVEDDQIPVIECPLDMTLEISSAVCDTSYVYSEMTSDNCEGEIVSLISGTGSGNPFPVGIHLEELQVEDIGGNTAGCSFNITVIKLPDLVADTICYGDSTFLEGAYQYLPGIFTDTFSNVYACDSIVITTLDTTTTCIWPTAIVYVDSAATGENSGVDWTNAYIDMQLALDVGERYQNVTQIWIAEGTYYPTQGVNRARSFVLIDSLIMLGGFQGVEIDSIDRNALLYPVILSGDIGNLEDSTDNSYHVVTNPDSSSGTRLDGFIIVHGTANGIDPDDQSGAGLVNYGTLVLTNCRLEQCSSTGLGALILNSGPTATLTLNNVSVIGQSPVHIWNMNQAELYFIGASGQIGN